MSRMFVMVHGRAQQGKDADDLKQEWLEALDEGLTGAGPSPASVRFPFYGDALAALTEDADSESVPEIVVRSVTAEGAVDDVGRLFQQIIAELVESVPVDAGSPDSAEKTVVQERLFGGRERLSDALAFLDRHVPGVSAASVAVATRDVARYLRNPRVRRRIDRGVAKSLEVAGNHPHVVVAHSLGSVVAYNLLSSPEAAGWDIRRLVTLGSPLGIRAVRNELEQVAFPANTTEWFNAYDRRDIVALHPLDERSFPVAGNGIVNFGDVRNDTSNHHGIGGYLADSTVAKRVLSP